MKKSKNSVFSQEEVATLKNLSSSMDGDNLKVIDMEDELKQFQLALLTKEHVFIEGEPGSAKSMLANRAFEAIDGASHFAIHMSKETTDDAIFGPVDIQKFRDEKKYVRNTDGYILDAELVFLDEIFDASEDTLRTLLTVLNERVWIRGHQKVTAKLHTAIATANYSTINEKTKAVIDRFIFKARSKGNFGKAKMLKVYQSYLESGEGFVPKNTVKYSELKELSDKLSSDEKFVTIGEDIISVYFDIVDSFRKESQKFISKRAENKGLRVVKAQALLNNRNKVNIADLESLRYVLCTVNVSEEKKLFDVAYARAVSSIKLKEDLNKLLKLSEAIVKEDTSVLNLENFIKLMKNSNMLYQKMDNMYQNCKSSMSTDEEKEYKSNVDALGKKIGEMQVKSKQIQQAGSSTNTSTEGNVAF